MLELVSVKPCFLERFSLSLLGCAIPLVVQYFSFIFSCVISLSHNVDLNNEVIFLLGKKNSSGRVRFYFMIVEVKWIYGSEHVGVFPFA